MIKVLFIIPSFFPAVKFGGPITSSLELCNVLANRKDCQIQVLTTDAGIYDHEREKLTVCENGNFQGRYKVFYSKSCLGEKFSIEFFRFLPALMRWADVVHLNAVYSFPTIPVIYYCKILDKPLVWTPRGALQRWHGTRKKTIKVFWDLICDNGAYRKGIVHLTSELEKIEAMDRLKKWRCEVVPSGVSLPLLNKKRLAVKSKGLKLLFVGRLDAIKGLEKLLKAMELLRNTDISLIVCGAGSKEYTLRIKQMISSFQLESVVQLKGHVTGKMKSEEFWNSDVCIVPSHKESFSMVVAEALAHGVPVIASTGTPWAKLEEMGCGLWVENSAESLANAIWRIMKMDLVAMGERGRKWMEREFSWEKIGTRIYRLYLEMTALEQKR